MSMEPRNRLSEIRAVVQTLYGPQIIKWRDAATAYVECVGQHLHTTPTGERDCWLKIDGAPTFKCQHNSCRELVEAEQFRVRSHLGKAFPNYARTVTSKKSKPAATKPIRLPFDPIDPPSPLEDQCESFLWSLFDFPLCDLAVSRAVWQKLNDGKGRYIPSPSKLYSFNDLLDQIRNNRGTQGLNPDSTGLFIRINPMSGKGTTDEDVDDFMHVLIDIDLDEFRNPISRSVQYGALIASGLPIATVVDTGNKGLHAIAKVYASDREEYNLRRDIVFRRMEQFVNVDRSAGNPSRFCRFPDAIRRLNPMTEEPPIYARQELIASDLGPPHWDEFLECNLPMNEPTTNNSIPINDTVTQLRSNAVIQSTSDPDNQSPRDSKSPKRVLRFANTSGGQEHEFSLNEALPRTAAELQGLTSMAGGPLWRLVGALLALEVEQGRPMQEQQVDDLLDRYYQELQKYGAEVGVTVASMVEVEDAFFRNKQARKVPEGFHQFQWAVQLAQQCALPPEAERWKDDHPKKAYFVAALRQMATLGNDATFFLGCRDAAEYGGLVDRNEASRWLSDLCTGRKPVLRLISKGKLKGGGKGDSSVYAYIPLEGEQCPPTS